MAKKQKITPFLWFDNQAEEAADFYTSFFGKSKILKTIRHANGVSVVKFSLSGQEFTAVNGGPKFKFNPSISLFVACKSAAETKRVWKQLLEGGTALMPLGKYDWCELYGWVQDKYGLSWQIMHGNFASTGQRFMPSFLFTGPQRNLAEPAIRRYTEIFDASKIVTLTRHAPDAAGHEGSLLYAEFQLAGQSFAAMDNPQTEAQFSFNEAVSFVVNCKGQKEVDYYWDQLSAGGGEESQCAWLKDPFGVSWQVVPDALTKLLGDPDPAVSQRAMANMFQMKKIVIRKLKSKPKVVRITVKTTVQAPLEKAWKCFTTPADIEQWNAASPDWHCPSAVNDLRPGGAFSYTMAARDGSFAFDFEGAYDAVDTGKRIEYTMADGRKAKITFKSKGKKTEVTEVFEAENMNPPDMQREGWQAILDHFGRHTEAAG
ncbi:MAG: VOC family protein [Saprospiraceae bacterium]